MGQWFEDIPSKIQPRFMLGGDVAAFRISLMDFENLYANRWGASFGGFAGVRAFGAYYFTVKYGNFHQNGKEGIDPSTGSSFASAKWREQWGKIGFRVHPPLERKWSSFYGFGIAAYRISENAQLSFFETDQQESTEEIGSGFYLEAGINYFVDPKAALFFELEIASGGVGGRSGFEAMSVGGWRFATGLSLWPF